MNVASMARPFQASARWLIAGLIAAALFAAAMMHGTPVGAAVWCGGQYTTYCPVAYAGYNPGYAGSYVYGYAPTNIAFRQYTDNRSNCPDGQVTQNGAGYFCTNYGVPAFVVNGNVPVNYVGYPGYAGYAGYAGYYPGYAAYYPYLYRP